MTEERLRREKEFHDARFGGDDSPRRSAGKFYSLMGPAHAFWRDRIVSLCRDKRLLELGCGTGGNATFLAQSAAHITGIDISPEGIGKATDRARENGIAADYRVMNAEDLQFEDRSFDLVVGTSILHHLRPDKAYSEIARVLSENGHAIFIEPLGHNLLVNLYRKLTPGMRTPDEHPLLMRDIRLGEEYFLHGEAEFFNLSTFLAVPLRNMRSFRSIFSLCGALDEALFRVFPFLKRYAWLVVLDFSRPKAG